MKARKKKLMFLGAGPSQLPAIRKAVSLGFYVITVDYFPGNLGHKFSHQFINSSTIDKEGVLDAARKLDINGIMTFASDVATPTVGFVAEKLGLSGGFPVAAEIMSNKAKFRALQRKYGLSCPAFVIGRYLHEIEAQITALSPPLMFKPIDSCGSRGISRVDNPRDDICFKAFEYAKKYSHSGTVCIEEFVEGIDASGDGFLVNGQLFAVLTHKHQKNYIPTGHGLPTNIRPMAQEKVLLEVTANCRALGYTDGPLDFDIRVSDQDVTVLEMSPRLGGNGIPQIIERGVGIDLIAATVHFALGEPVTFPKTLEITNNCGSLVFGSERSGVLGEIATKNELQALIPQVFEYAVHYEIGTTVPNFTHSANSLGYVLFDCPPESSYSEMVARIRAAMQLNIG